MSFDELYTRWSEANYGDPVDAFHSYLSCTYDVMCNDGCVFDNLIDEDALDYSNRLFTADELLFLLFDPLAA